MITKKDDGFWVDENGNTWSGGFSKEEAEQKSSTLTSCYHNHNCDNCANCYNCSNCSNCSDCSNCSTCRDCSNCSACYIGSNCRDCSACRDCSNCSNCSNCSKCSNCSNCHNCYKCSNCSGCGSSINIAHFSDNPEQIVSPKLGSRKSQTYFYFSKDRQMVVCGCFTGTLQEFEEAVDKRHGNSKDGIEYKKWIERVKLYIQSREL